MSLWEHLGENFYGLFICLWCLSHMEDFKWTSKTQSEGILQMQTLGSIYGTL